MDFVIVGLVTITHNAANTPSITRTSSFTYNSDGLLKSETIAPNTNKSLTTTYEYDSLVVVVVPSALVSLACLPSASYSQVVVSPFGPVKVKTSITATGS
jgi:hypothetical protein